MCNGYIYILNRSTIADAAAAVRRKDSWKKKCLEETRKAATATKGDCLEGPITELLKCLLAILSQRCKMERRDALSRFAISASGIPFIFIFCSSVFLVPYPHARCVCPRSSVDPLFLFFRSLFIHATHALTFYLVCHHPALWLSASSSSSSRHLSSPPSFGPECLPPRSHPVYVEAFRTINPRSACTRPLLVSSSRASSSSSSFSSCNPFGIFTLAC